VRVKPRARLAVPAIAIIATAALVAACAGTTEPGAVRTDAGLVSGLSLPDGVRAYRGVPFGAPPVGELRWREPQPVTPWDGVRLAETFGDVCVQPPGQGRVNVSVDLPDSPPASEDCLYLNVWTAAERADERRPVMVWIFGGAFSEGAGSSPHNDGTALARKGVVLVTFNYRLGPFGFFSHPELTRESGRGASGNQGVMDAIAVLRWVQRNIAAFGGDPDNVTIFGESAGAVMVAGLTGSPQARGLFHRAIAESGAWMGLSMARMGTREAAERSASGRGAGRGGRGGDGGRAPQVESLATLRAKPTGDIAALRGAGMIVDGWVVPEDLSITFQQGRQNAVDVLAGVNKDEGTSFGPGASAEAWVAQVRDRWGELSDDYLALYPAGSDEEAVASSRARSSDEMFWHMKLFADAQVRLGKQAWLYYFTHQPPYAPGAQDLGATHTVEIPYVFDNLAAPRVFPDASSPELAVASEAERAFAERVSSYWVNFARAGDPNGAGLERWPAFGSDDAWRAMILGPPVEPPDDEKLNLYDRLYERQMAR